MRYGIKIETYCIAGRYQHKISEIGVGSDRIGEISNEVVESQKRVNEMLWGEMPKGATGLVAIIQYKTPGKKN